MQTPRQAVDTLIEARWVIPVEPARAVLANHAVAIADGCITAILPCDEARERYSARAHVCLGQHVLIPGLINLHTHAAMTLLRGLSDDLGLMEWLKQHIWPAEARHLSEEFVYDGSRLACAEMLRGGITSFNDMYFYPRETARAVLQARMRATIGLIVVDFATSYASDVQDYLTKGFALRDELRDEPLLGFCFAPHAPYTVSDQGLRDIAMYAGELDLPVHMHVHETLGEIEQGVSAHGIRPLQRLQNLGLLGLGLTAVHCVHLHETEIDMLASHGCSVAHCPSSNLKLASGFAPIGALLAHGINVGLGTDGAASNNRLDMFTEMRQAALLAKAVGGDASALPAWQALEMATLNGARALALDRMTGSLVAGKQADITAVSLESIDLAPCYDPLSHLVYAAGREHVSHVWVNGEPVLKDGVLTTLDERELRNRADYWADKIRG